MRYNWQQEDWPNFTYDLSGLEESLFRFAEAQGQLNSRQEKVLNRMFEAGPAGFEGGMSAKKYQSIAKTSKATATRDLQDLVRMGAVVVRRTWYGLKG